MRKNEIVTLEITDINNLGFGVGRCDGVVVFVAGAVSGDTVKAKIIKVNKSWCVGKLEEIIISSPHRTAERYCTAPESCGGCVYRNVTYSHELEKKREYVKNAFRKCGLPDVSVGEVLTAGDIKGYRNKAQYPVKGENGKIRAGFYAAKTHNIVPSESCSLQLPIFARVVDFICSFAERNGWSAYDEIRGKGLLRHIYLRAGEATGELMVCLVVNGRDIPCRESFVKELCGEFENVKSVLLSVNTKNTNVVLGDEFILIGGRDYIEDVLCGVRFRISAGSFYQVNRKGAELLYGIAADLAKPEGKTVIDLYCGTGTIGLSMAKRAERVVGIEIVDEAVRCAKINAEINGIDNAEFYCGDASDAEGLLGAAERQSGSRISPDVVIMDPPRKGSTPELINYLSRIDARHVVYVSCDPDTLARDCAEFTRLGYTMSEVTPVNMFPRTGHVESVVCLSREKADDYRKESKMISDEKSAYKSWSNLKKQMNDLLCDSLKGKISYFYTSYHEVHNAYGRATIQYEKKEIVAFSWDRQYEQVQDIKEQYRKMDNVPSMFVDYEGSLNAYKTANIAATREKWMPNCTLCETDFINSLTIYLKTDIATSLNSDNYLLRVFAYMDRRVGKRTLIKIKDDVEKLPDWVKQFYQIRCEADGIVFPPKRITDESVICLTRR